VHNVYSSAVSPKSTEAVGVPYMFAIVTGSIRNYVSNFKVVHCFNDIFMLLYFA